MKRHSTRLLIAESKAVHRGGRCETSEAWLYWDGVRSSPTSSSANPRNSSTWVVQCEWNAAEEDASSDADDVYPKRNSNGQGVVRVPFLTESDVVDLILRNRGDDGRESGLSKKTHAVLSRPADALRGRSLICRRRPTSRKTLARP